MIVASVLRKLLWVFQYPRFITENAGPHDVGMMRVRIPGATACQVHYPCERVETTKNPNDGAFHPYFRPESVIGLSKFAKTEPGLLQFLSDRPHPCRVDADPIATRQEFPIVIFSHGLGGCMEMYSGLCTQLSSQGYTVLALEHEDGSGSYAENAQGEPIFYQPPDDSPYSRQKVLNFRGPMLQQRVDEVKRVLDFLQSGDSEKEEDARLRKLLRAAETCEGISLVGHSFGASTMALASQQLLDKSEITKQSKLKSVTLLDPWAFSLDDTVLEAGISIPTLSILSNHWMKGPESDQVLQLLRASKSLTSMYLPHSVHQSFSDTPCWLPGWIAKKMYMRAEEEKRHETILAVAEAYKEHTNSITSTESKSDDSATTLDYSSDVLKPFPVKQEVSFVVA